jgi:hypothetical protein
MDFFEKLFLKNQDYFDAMPVKVKDIAVWLPARVRQAGCQRT